MSPFAQIAIAAAVYSGWTMCSVLRAQAIEARSGKTRSGLIEDESAVRQDAPKTPAKYLRLHNIEGETR